jgi:hypothetical protein
MDRQLSKLKTTEFLTFISLYYDIELDLANVT